MLSAVEEKMKKSRRSFFGLMLAPLCIPFAHWLPRKESTSVLLQTKMNMACNMMLDTMSADIYSSACAELTIDDRLKGHLHGIDCGCPPHTRPLSYDKMNETYAMALAERHQPDLYLIRPGSAIKTEPNLYWWSSDGLYKWKSFSKGVILPRELMSV